MLAAKPHPIDHVPIIRHRHNWVCVSLCRDRLVDAKKDFCHDDEVRAWDVVLLDDLADDDFGCAYGVEVRLLLRVSFWVE